VYLVLGIGDEVHHSSVIGQRHQQQYTHSTELASIRIFVQQKTVKLFVKLQ
jgi:hypothetical protein